MNCCFQIEKIILPRQFLFDSLRLFAKFQSTAVDLLTLGFDLSQANTQRSVDLNVQLRVPTTRCKFNLVLQVKIINMRVSPCEVTVDLAIKDCNQFQYVFQTEMGRVSAYANVIQHHSLPKEYEITPSEESMMSEASELSSQNKELFFSEERKFQKQSTSKELKTNDEEQRHFNKEKPNDAEVVHFEV